MLPTPSPRRVVAALLDLLCLVHAHTVIVYPGWRGDNLMPSNCTIGVDDYKTGCFPYGMQWMYPCKSRCLRYLSAQASIQPTYLPLPRS